MRALKLFGLAWLLVGGCGANHPPAPQPTLAASYYFTELVASGHPPTRLRRVTADGVISPGPELPTRAGIALDFLPSPDGHSLLLGDGGILAADGRRLGAVSGRPGYSVWDADGDHICSALDQDGNLPVVTFVGGPAPYGLVQFSRSIYLWLERAGEKPRRVAEIPGTPDGSGFRLLTCNLAEDRATLDTHPKLYRIRLSDGTRTPVARMPGPGPRITSLDGLLAARNEGGSEAWVAGVYDRDGHEMARFPGTTVIAFSSDGDLVLDEHGPAGAPDVAEPVHLREWRSGLIRWSGEGSVVGAVARPGGDGFLLSLAAPHRSPDRQELWIVHKDGRSELIASGVTAHLPPAS